ncbi:substrate-binding periplasmic protein [Aliikangiella coralliicola]|uniref:Amino acid ABC transporter substrate-binding protein n=1 Tax=Aliikangiella coralliicola TaxID=2592383 RepID=A0A545UBM5_9GAMM|nr:transporter substrate-binding domain-containing protein [Aliikangiella coralliicola]TQV86871.1 amino acid ABC transporter substrate-binding protein [Aliikangiella coralliicola]
MIQQGMPLFVRIFSFPLLFLLTTLSIKVAATSISTASISAEAHSKKCQLNYGWTEWKPLQYLDKRGKIIGLQIDLVEAIAESLNCDINFIKGRWNDNLEKIRTGEVDFTANATPSEKRKQFAHFSNPYRQDSFAVFVRMEDVEKYNAGTINALKLIDFKLGLAKQYLYGEEVEAWQSDNQYNYLLTYSAVAEDNFSKLIKGEIDGFLEDPFVISYKLRSKDLTKKVVPLPIRTTGREVCFIFSKKTVSKNFVSQFNRALTKIKNNPKYQSIWLDSSFNK